MSDQYIDDCPYCGGAGQEDLIVQQMPDGGTEMTHIEAFLPDELQAMLDAGATIQRNVACEDCDGTGELDRSDDTEYVTMIDEQEEYIDEWRELARPLEELTGIQHWAFDPDVAFHYGEKSVSIPRWLLELINKGLAELTAPEEKEE